MLKQIEIPKTCPSCSSKLEEVNMRLYCKNILCPARSTKGVEHFIKTIGIKGLGEKTIEKLNITHFTELFSLTYEDLVSRLSSEKIAAKLVEEIEKAKTVSLSTIIASFGIPLVGKTIAAKLSSIESIEDINFELCKTLGIGDKASINLVEFIQTDFQDIKQYLPFENLYNNKETKTNIKKTVCITGKLKSFKTKSEAKKALEDLGLTVVENLTKSTDILVDEENKGSSKRIKAEELGISIVTNLLTFINETSNDNN